MASVEHVRINLKQIAERLAISEAQLARSVTASMPVGLGAVPPMGTFSAAATAAAMPPSNGSIASQDFDENSGLLSSSNPYGRYTSSAPIAIARDSHLGDHYGDAAPASSINATSFHAAARVDGDGSFAVGSRRPMLLASSARPGLMSSSMARPGVAVNNSSFANLRRTPPQGSFAPGSVSGPRIGGASMSRAAAGVPPMGASVSRANGPALGTSLRGAVPMMVRVSRGLSTLDGPQQLPPAAPSDADDLGGDGGKHDLVLQQTADGTVSFAVISRDTSPLRPSSRTESKLTRGDSRLTDRSHGDASGVADASVAMVAMTPMQQAEEKKKSVRFATEPISHVTIFATPDQGVVLQVEYSRPVWCLAVGAATAILRALVWAMVCHTMHKQLMPTYPAGMLLNPDNAFGEEVQSLDRAIAVVTRLGFEIYCGCALVFGLIMFIFWRPSSRDLKSLRSRREKRRLAIAVTSGSIARMGLVLGLGFVSSATNVAMHYALPLIWVIGARSAFRKRPTAYTDLLAACILCVAVVFLLKGDMGERVPHWQIERRWVALPLVVLTSVLRGVQRSFSKSLKAHFSHRLMLIFTMVADAVAMFVAAIVADGGVMGRVLKADADEATTAIVAIVGMTLAFIGDVLVARYFDMVTSLALATLSLPSAMIFFKSFGLIAPSVTWAFVCSLTAVIATSVALGSSQVNRKVKNLVLTESDGRDHSDTSSEHSHSS